MPWGPLYISIYAAEYKSSSKYKESLGKENWECKNNKGKKLPVILMAMFIQTKYFLVTFLKNNCQNISMASEQYLWKNLLVY